MNIFKYRHTIFTPTFNRQALIQDLYCRLLDLHYSRDGFEWLIVDDGSTDNTREIVQGFIDDAKLNVRYFWQENRGIHCAQNKAISLADGEFVTRIDTDDYLLPDALAVKDKYWDEIPDEAKASFVGVVGLTLNPDGSFRCSPLPADIVDSTGLELKNKCAATGDRNYCMRTEVMRRFPIPEYSDTKYVPESIIWRRIDREYKTRFINVPISVCANDADGSMMKEMGRKNRSAQNYLSGFYGAQHQLNEFFVDLSLFEKIKLGVVFLYYGRMSKKATGYFELLKKLDSNFVRFFCFMLIPACEIIKAVKGVRVGS